MDSFVATTTATMDEAEEQVRVALQEQGFGVLTEIDVAANLKRALGVDRPPLKILGACNPNFAQRALEIDRSVALLMPCNVVLERTDDTTLVAAVDPRELITDPRFAELATDAAERLQAAVRAVEQ
jgi:uncharacterized protein (DUF302 family)